MRKNFLSPIAIGLMTSMAIVTSSGVFADTSTQKQNYSSSSQITAQAALPQLPFRSNLAYSTGVSAYIYGYTLVEMARTMQKFEQTNELNTFKHDRNLADDKFRDFVKPNNDTLYSQSWLDLSKGPQVLSFPKINRYFTFQFMDAYSNSFKYIGGSNKKEYKGGKYIIVGPDWKGKFPKGVNVIKSPTNMTWVLGRTLVDGEKDLTEVHKIQDSYKLAPLNRNQAKGSINIPTIQTNDYDDPIKFFNLMAQLMKLNPAPQRDEALLSQLEFIDLDPVTGLFTGTADPVVLDGLTSAVKDGKEAIQKSLLVLQKPNNGNWTVNYDRVGTYGVYYLNRAMIAMNALGANIPKEAVYAITRKDSDGNTLSGQSKYVIHFDKNNLPPVNDFWSICIYDSTNYFIANPINRFSIGDRTEGLKYNIDGSLDIYVQSTAPVGHESNWLPSPSSTTNTGFALLLRMYTPKESVQNNSYIIPSVKISSEQ
ncbi:DUF1254 domain-containing protein [Gottfriedia sp. NPDC058432]|uniref:DUF1254 domain-containing protein n=1 Tax=Gottfriedia sp. NPDC058432 TaxID=3346497 RepID=UPI00364D7B2B